MKTILLAGATGHLGRLVAQELKARGYAVHALARQPSKLANLELDKVISADLTNPTSLQKVCQDVEAVLSCAGASMSMANFGDRKFFYDVDYRGNLNLLNEAKNSSVQKFVYVSLAGADKLRQVEYADAHEKFVDALKTSGLTYSVVRPTGFFSFLLELLGFAKRGFGVVIGDGSCKTNPVHEADVARACVEALESNQTEMVVGGPDVFTRKETSLLAFEALHKKARLMTVSPKMFKAMIAPLKLSNKRIYALMDFGIAVTQISLVAPTYGTRHLKDYFEHHAKYLS
jgi:uncharacterized protein YbjT (DUF2867 family)